MAARDSLVQETGNFFDLHGGNMATPAWDFSWDGCGAIPNHELDGVYALLSGETLVFVGLGAGHSYGSQKKHGIRKRLLAHVLEVAPADTDVNYILEQRWRNAGVDRIATLGFPPETSYLACALEHYLIAKLDPPENHKNHHPRSH
ncbi:MAG: hypothetical protein H6R07_2678 [Proteobacteria bacterium]|nr:hypothetical protein [Pseudomonadota bacterium]